VDDIEKTIRFLKEQQAVAEARRAGAVGCSLNQWESAFQENMQAIEQIQAGQLRVIHRLLDLSAQALRRLDRTQVKLDALKATAEHYSP
jgi:hypothetical protein